MSSKNERPTAIKVELKGKVEDTQIATWKEKHGDVFGVIISNKVGYFRYPTFNDLNCYYATKDKNKVTDSWKELADLLWLGGCEELLGVRHLMGVYNELLNVIAGEAAEVVNY